MFSINEIFINKKLNFNQKMLFNKIFINNKIGFLLKMIQKIERLQQNKDLPTKNISKEVTLLKTLKRGPSNFNKKASYKELSTEQF